MQTRTLAVLAVALVTLSAGCGFLLGNEALEFAANPATVADDATTETGYEETNVTAVNLTQNVTVADQTRTVRLVNHRATYERQVDLPGLDTDQRAALLMTLSSPEIDVAGQTLNPLSGVDERDIVQRFDTGYEGLQVGQQVDNRSVQALGANRSVEQFEGTATLGGAELDVYVHATTFKHGDDFVTAVAIYPRAVDGEDERVVTLLEGLEHERGEGSE